jgi:hypothetical protein
LIVDWDGPDDPQNPKKCVACADEAEWWLGLWFLHSWSYRHKWATALVISAFSFISPVSSSMVAPAIDQVASAFGIKNDVVLALTTSIFVLAFGKRICRMLDTPLINQITY